MSFSTSISCQFEYVVLPGKNPTGSLIEIYDTAFHFWYDNWSTYYQKLDPDYNFVADDFFRQDAVGVLFENKVPVGIHLYSIFNLVGNSIFEQSYLKQNFSDSYFLNLKKLNISTVMTFESMMICPKRRKVKTGKSIAPFLLSLSYQYLLSRTDVQSMIAPARSDVGIAQLACCGGSEVIENRILHGVPVSLIIGRREKLHLNFLAPDEQKLSREVFKNYLSQYSKGDIKNENIEILAG